MLMSSQEKELFTGLLHLNWSWGIWVDYKKKDKTPDDNQHMSM
jgi:hypothetical protein